jgi:hypothetical protein
LAYTQLPAITTAAAEGEEGDYDDDYDYNSDNMVTNFMQRE